MLPSCDCCCLVLSIQARRHKPYMGLSVHVGSAYISARRTFSQPIWPAECTAGHLAGGMYAEPKCGLRPCTVYIRPLSKVSRGLRLLQNTVQEELHRSTLAGEKQTRESSPFALR